MAEIEYDNRPENTRELIERIIDLIFLSVDDLIDWFTESIKALWQEIIE